MDASDWALIGAISVVGFIIIHAALWGLWIAIRNEIRSARAEIRAICAGVRVSDAELERAWMEGVMSVLQPQAHAHEYTGARPNPTAESQSPPPTASD